jgi:hypothetical protein
VDLDSVREMSDDTLILLLFVWGVSALVAGLIASDRDRSFFGFAAVTFFFLGPLGPGFALLANHGQVEKSYRQAAHAAAYAATQAATPPAKRKTEREVIAESIKEADKAAAEAQAEAEAARARVEELRRRAAGEKPAKDAKD